MIVELIRLVVVGILHQQIERPAAGFGRFDRVAQDLRSEPTAVDCDQFHPRTDAGLGKQVQLHFAGGGCEKMPAFGDIEKQKIGAIVKIIVKPILRGEGDGSIYCVVVEGSLDTGILVGKYELGMIEIDLESPPSLLIEQEPQPIVVLRDGQRF